MSGFTPGPWEPPLGAYRMNATGEGAMFSGGDWYITPPIGEAGPVAVANSEANAALIAAAPELYEALTQAVRYAELACKAEGMPEGSQPARLTIQEEGGELFVFDVKAARAALAKAVPPQET